MVRGQQSVRSLGVTSCPLPRRSRYHAFLSVVVLAAALWAPSAARAGVWVSRGPYGGAVRALAVAPTFPPSVYAGTNGGVFKTTDGGASWSAVNSGLTTTNVVDLAIDPTAPETLYAATDGGVFKTTTGGASWSAAKVGLPDETVFVLAIDPTAPATLYAGTFLSGVFKTIDGGSSWS